jgi:hypothetical protein
MDPVEQWARQATLQHWGKMIHRQAMHSWVGGGPGVRLVWRLVACGLPVLVVAWRGPSTVKGSHWASRVIEACCGEAGATVHHEWERGYCEFGTCRRPAQAGC